jgi:hypothetical protein
MLYLFAMYWPFLVAALAAGIGIGWWHQDERSADELAAWLDHGLDEP